MDSYEISELIGEGSFGRVFRAKERSGQRRTVAIKLIPKVGKTDREVAALRAELKIQQSLRPHPNVVRMIDAFETPKELVAVTEFVSGGELHGMTKVDDDGAGKRIGRTRSRTRRKVLPEETVKRIACDVLSALHFLHSNRILHRDVKPQNILIDEQGRAKLCDFGFARNISEKTLVLTSVKGTPLYMAPEVMEGKPYDQTVDLWSVGCILYELCAGITPFHSSDLAKLVGKVRYDSIPPIPESHVGVGAECRDFIMRLLEKDPLRRLKWQEVLAHPFVAGHIAELPPEQSGAPSCFSPFTDPMSDSQELAKEIQRQEKAKRLAQSASQQPLLIMAQKQKEERDRLRKMRLRGEMALDPSSQWNYPNIANLEGGRRRNSDISGLLALGTTPQFESLRRHSDLVGGYGSALGFYQDPLLLNAHYITPQQPCLPKHGHEEQLVTETLERLNIDSKEVFSDKQANDGTSEGRRSPIWNDYASWHRRIEAELRDPDSLVASMGNQNFVSILIKPLELEPVLPVVMSKVVSTFASFFLTVNNCPDGAVRLSAASGAFSRAHAVTTLMSATRRCNDQDWVERVAVTITRLALTDIKLLDELIAAMADEDNWLLLSWMLDQTGPVRRQCLAWMLLVSDKEKALGRKLTDALLSEKVAQVAEKEEDVTSATRIKTIRELCN